MPSARTLRKDQFAMKTGVKVRAVAATHRDGQPARAEPPGHQPGDGQATKQKPVQGGRSRQRNLSCGRNGGQHRHQNSCEDQCIHHPGRAEPQRKLNDALGFEEEEGRTKANKSR